MIEKQTTQPENSLNQPQGDIISDADYAMIKEWERDNAAATAARRTVDIDSTPTDTEAHYQSQDDKSRIRKPTGKQILAGAGVTVAVLGGATGIHHLQGGDDNSERGEADTSIESITLSPDANIRFDPKVDDDVVGPNIALQLEEAREIDIMEDIRVLENTNNGTWYGIATADIAALAPEATDTHDNDGILWVNEQGVESIQKNDTESNE